MKIQKKNQLVLASVISLIACISFFPIIVLGATYLYPTSYYRYWGTILDGDLGSFTSSHDGDVFEVKSQITGIPGVGTAIDIRLNYADSNNPTTTSYTLIYVKYDRADSDKMTIFTSS